MDRGQLTHRLKQRAGELGFSLGGACPAVTPAGISRFHEWLAADYGGQMGYLKERAAAYEHPGHVLPGVRSLLMLALPYSNHRLPVESPGRGRVARYAAGAADYHDLIHSRLKALAALHRDLAPDESVRGVVDTAPLLEREFAALAGLGWIGKNTLLLNRRQGSYFFLAALLTSAELEYDPPDPTDHCGSCRACLDACPTDAFPQPYVLDATRCISYLTIELRDHVPAEFRQSLGDWTFGCDVCQEVCPWNRFSPGAAASQLEPAGELNPLDLIGLFDLEDDAFRRRFRKLPLWRPRRRGMLRNAALVLGNQRHSAAVGALAKGLADSEPVVRSACAWALGRIGSSAAREALRTRLPAENESAVLSEISGALAASEDH